MTKEQMQANNRRWKAEGKHYAEYLGSTWRVAVDADQDGFGDDVEKSGSFEEAYNQARVLNGVRLKAIPSRTSFYFTEGKEYAARPRQSFRHTLAEVTDDLGHMRIIGLDEGPSAHLWDPEEWKAGGPGRRLGHFRIEEVPA